RVVPVQHDSQRAASEHALDKSLVGAAFDLADERSPRLGQRQVRSIVQRQPVMALLAVFALFAEASVEQLWRWKGVDEAVVFVGRREAGWVHPRVGLLRLESGAVEPVHDGFVDVSHADFAVDRSRAASERQRQSRRARRAYLVAGPTGFYVP